MQKYKPAVARGVKVVADKLRQMRIENNGTLDDGGLQSQWQRYQSLPMADRAVWVSRRVGTENKAAIEEQMIRFEDEMKKKF